MCGAASPVIAGDGGSFNAGSAVCCCTNLMGAAQTSAQSFRNLLAKLAMLTCCVGGGAGVVAGAGDGLAENCDMG